MIDDSIEQEVWSKGSLLLGVDEAGMGPLAGSLFVGGVIFHKDYDFDRLKGLNDSKKLSAKKRFELEPIVKADALYWFVEEVSPAIVDTDSAYHARFHAAARKVVEVEERGLELVVLMDGNVTIKLPETSSSESRCLVKGDAKCFSVAAASILAKTAKDKEMICLDKEYPAYDWSSNKGYGTANHIEAIKKFGLTPYHRRTYCRKFEDDSGA